MIKISQFGQGRRSAIGASLPVEEVYAAGSAIAVKRWGKGRPVLCLHAAGHGSGDFEPFALQVQNTFEVIAPDWPGQGRSPGDGRGPDAFHYADITADLCQTLNLERPLLIGNSIGGAAALIAAHRAPESFSGLVLCNAAGLAPIDQAARFAIGRMVAFFKAGKRGATWFDPAFAAYYRHMVLPRSGARAQRERIIAARAELAPLLADAWRSFAEEKADLRSMAPDVPIPVWCAWAKSDQLVAWRRSRKAALTFPDVSVSLFRGGHAPFLEDTDAFVAGFLKLAERAQARLTPVHVS